jgi:hypothetical protein
MNDLDKLIEHYGHLMPPEQIAAWRTLADLRRDDATEKQFHALLADFVLEIAEILRSRT